MKNRTLIRKQLDKSLTAFEPLLKTSVPPRGWIRAIRDGLGMSARQLASRMNVAQQAVARIEKDEIHGAVTLKMMRKVAEQMNCVFVYGFIPKTSLEETVSKQVSLVIKRRMEDVNHSMALEDQALDSTQYRAITEELSEEYQSSSPRDLWDYK